MNMAHEKTVWEYTKQAGYEPLEGRTIIVRPAPNDLSSKIVQFFQWTSDIYALQMCKNELVCLPFDPNWTTLRKEAFLVLPYQDIESIEFSEDLLNTVVELHTQNGDIRFTTQQEALSNCRTSGAYAMQFAGGFKNWHKDNFKATLEALSNLGA